MIAASQRVDKNPGEKQQPLPQYYFQHLKIIRQTK